MRRDLTNNYRKMHHLPKFHRSYIRTKYYKNGWLKHGIRRLRTGEAQRLIIRMDETNAFKPFYWAMRECFRIGETHADPAKDLAKQIKFIKENSIYGLGGEDNELLRKLRTGY